MSGSASSSSRVNSQHSRRSGANEPDLETTPVLIGLIHHPEPLRTMMVSKDVGFRSRVFSADSTKAGKDTTTGKWTARKQSGRVIKFFRSHKAVP